MNSPQPSWLFLDIGAATYADLDCLKNLLCEVETQREYWSLLHPNHLRQIISNAEKRLLSICRQYMTERFNSFARTCARPIKNQLQPSSNMMLQVKQFIDGNIDAIGKEVSHYEYSYQLFINSKQKYENCLIQVYGEQNSMVTTANFSETLLNSGPSLAMLNLAQQDYEKRHQRLNRHFDEILQKTAVHLEGMEERTFQAISRYIDRLESNKFYA